MLHEPLSFASPAPRLPPCPLQRSLIVDVPALGYEKGIGEMPASATFELQVEVLEVVRRA